MLSTQAWSVVTFKDKTPQICAMGWYQHLRPRGADERSTKGALKSISAFCQRETENGETKKAQNGGVWLSQPRWKVCPRAKFYQDFECIRRARPGQKKTTKKRDKLPNVASCKTTKHQSAQLEHLVWNTHKTPGGHFYSTIRTWTSWTESYSPVQSNRSCSCGDSPVARGESSCSSISASRASRRFPFSPNRHWLQNCRLETNDWILLLLFIFISSYKLDLF